MSVMMAEDAAGLSAGSEPSGCAGESRPQSPALSSSSSNSRFTPASTGTDVSPPPARMRHMVSWNSTRICPFSFDARDSMQRVAREKKLEERRQMEESRLDVSSKFRANPVRKYKPLVLKQSTRPLTIPQDPFSHCDT